MCTGHLFRAVKGARGGGGDDLPPPLPQPHGKQPTNSRCQDESGGASPRCCCRAHAWFHLLILTVSVVLCLEGSMQKSTSKSTSKYRQNRAERSVGPSVLSHLGRTSSRQRRGRRRPRLACAGVQRLCCSGPASNQLRAEKFRPKKAWREFSAQP